MAFSILNLSFSSTFTPLNSTILHKPSRTHDKLCCSLASPLPEYIPGKISDPFYVRVLDTTLRDGEQAPGAAMTVAQKLSIARKLATLGVDVIEAGFPASSKENFRATELVAMEVGNEVDADSGHVPVIAAIARCVRGDVEAAWAAVKKAKRPRVKVFIATSEIHMKYKLKKSEDEVTKLAGETVRYIKSLGCHDIEFGCEDAGRSEKGLLYRVYGEAINGGATTILFADTVGYNFPEEVADFIAHMKANIPEMENVVVAVHCHNDLGLATANALAGVYAGARQVDVTINGIGERAGNTPLEELVMAMKCRGNDLKGGLHTGVDTKHIITTSKMVEEYSGISVQPHKPIVGANVFSHASGIHQDGILKHKSTYQIIYPQDIGLSAGSNDHGIVLGKLSGRNALKSRLLQLGYELDEKKLDDIFQQFKETADEKKYVSDKDIESLMEASYPTTSGP